MKDVVECLGKVGLKIKRKKCEFGRKFLEYLGHQVECGRVTVPEDCVRVMAEFLRPVTKKQLRSFPGSMSYYRQFIDGFADMSATLTPAVSLTSPTMVTWTEEKSVAFTRLRQLLCKRVVLFFPVCDDVFYFFTDASGAGIGACLHVKRNSEKLPVAFLSR